MRCAYYLVMRYRVVGLGVWPLLVALSCSSDEQPGGSGAGSPADGGESAGEPGGGIQGGGTTHTGGTGGGGNQAIAGGGGEAPVGVAGDAGSSTGAVGGVAGAAGAGAAAGAGGAAGGVTAGAAGEAGFGGSDEGGAASCISDVGVMPAGPLAPVAAECASGCSVPPFDGVTLPTGCGDASNVPPAAAIGAPTGVPPGGAIVVSGQPPQTNGSWMTGAPCDVGWCASVVPSVVPVGLSTSAGPYFESAALKAGAGDVVHVARAQNDYSFDYFTFGPIASYALVDPANWADFVPAPAPGTSDGWVAFGYPGGPVLGVDPRPNQNHVYLAYAGVSSQAPGPPLSGPRFGAMVGEDSVFEDLPEGWDPLTDIQIDEHGDAIVLQKGSVYRYVGPANWEPVPVPCSITTVSGLAIDAENAVWYLLSDDTTLYRRAANGSWTKTASPGGQLVFAGGTVHLVSGVTAVHRVGTQWSQPLVAPRGDPGVSPAKMAIDACWAPHVASAREYDPTYYFFEMDYTRWTSRGFLTLRMGSNDFPDIELAVASGHAYVHGGGNIVGLPAH